VQEQGDGVGLAAVASSFHTQPAQAVKLLAGQFQRRLRSGEHARVGGGLQDGACQRGGGLQQVLAVVQHQQAGLFAKGLQHRGLRVQPGAAAAQRARHRVGQQRGVGQRRQLGDAGARLRFGQGARQGGLADAGRADDGEQALRGQQAGAAGQVGGAANGG
jgi:hypothetical protein